MQKKEFVKYKQGSTEAWSDGDKIIITNPSGKKHLEYNVDQIFGLGEYAKIVEVNYSFEEERTFNPHAKEIKIISGYIPQRVVDDLGLVKDKGVGEDLISEYFTK
jgi:hypothetical protein